MRRTPKYPVGYTPGKAFTDTGEPFGLKVALVTRVDEVNMKADLKILTGAGDRFEIDLTQAMAGPRSFWGGVPEVNSIVIVGYRRIHKDLYDAMILGYIPVGNRSGLRFDPFTIVDPREVPAEEQALVDDLVGPTTRYKRLLLKQGDVGGMSSSGSELVLSKDVSFVNRAGDLFELRDADRTLVSQAIHRVEGAAGVKSLTGPIRRGAFYLPDDVFSSGRQLKTEAEGYFGTDELQEAGPGLKGASSKYANASGEVLDLFNNFTEFPAVTFSNGRRFHYPPTSPGVSIEDPNSSADAFVEDRMEMFHTSDLTQEVFDEIDGFSSTRRTVYIERVMGTVVGNDMSTTRGQRQYGRILKPKLFPEFLSPKPGRFTLEEVDRQATAPDIDTYTTAGAFLFRIRPPRATGSNDFVAAVSKQGKLFLNVPASNVEDYPSGAKKISAELNLEGALKAYIGSSAPDRISAHVTLDGGLYLDVGRDVQGNAITVRYRSGVKAIYEGNPNEDDVATSEQIVGVKQTSITGAENKTIEGAKNTIVSGMVAVQCDRYNVNAHSGMSGNYGEWNLMVSGKSQLQYAQAVIENIIAGGRVTTITAGGLVLTVAAGAVAETASAGAWSTNVASGAYSVTVGTGAISITTSSGAVTLSTASGAMALSAAGGAVSITAGLALTLTASTNCTISAPTILLGGPTAVLGVVRGVPTYPAGTPTLDFTTGQPLLGSATVMSN